jgi:hypothetical protein
MPPLAGTHAVSGAGGLPDGGGLAPLPPAGGGAPDFPCGGGVPRPLPPLDGRVGGRCFEGTLGP